MINFKRLVLRNFLSFGNAPTEIDLTRVGSTLIVGRNLDDTSTGITSNGVGKAQPLHCKIKTPSGWTTMGEIKLGDVITAADGTPSTVSGVFPQGVRPTYRVTFADGRTTEADENHLWSVFSHRWISDKNSSANRNRGLRTITTLELAALLAEGDARTTNRPWYHLFVPLATPGDTADVELPIDPYALGALLGDGTFGPVNRGKVSNTVMFSSVDDAIINRVVSGTKSLGVELVPGGPSSSKDYRFRSVNPVRIGRTTAPHELSVRLTELGLMGTRSHTKFIPEVYKHGSVTQRRELIRGLLDTDGTVSNNGSVTLTSTSKRLIEDVQYIVRSLGGTAKVSHVRSPFYYDANRVKVMGKPAYDLVISAPNLQDLFTIERKRERVSATPQYANAGLRVVKVERIEDQECQCIMIEHPTHLYVTDDFVVTHNTTIVNAIVYALYDKPLSSINKDRLVNMINGKHMEVTLVFESGGVYYKISRYRKMKAGPYGNYAKLWIRQGDDAFDESNEITLDRNSNTTRYIEQAIGIPYELFVRIVVLSGSGIPFLSMPSKHPTQPSQQSFIEELFDLKMLTQKAEVLKTRIKENEEEFAVIKLRNDMAEKQRQHHDKQVRETQAKLAQWDEQRDSDVHDARAALRRIEGVDLVDQRQVFESIQEHTRNSRDLKLQLVALTRDKTDAETAISKLKEELSHLEDATCPYCAQEYHNQEKIASTIASIDDLSFVSGGLSNQIRMVQDQLALSQDALIDLRSRLKFDDIEELLTITFKKDEIAATIARREIEVNPYIAVLEMIHNQKPEDVDFTRLNELNELLEHQRFLLKLLTKNDSFIRKAMLNKNLPFLNRQLNTYLRHMGLPHVVEFTHDLTPRITRFGSEFDFDQLSAGQRARVNFALSLSFRDVLQNLHQRVNLCCVDEVLDLGLDSPGVQMAAKLLKEEARKTGTCLFVISHREEITSSFDAKMYVLYKDSFSRAYQTPEDVLSAEIMLHDAA